MQENEPVKRPRGRPKGVKPVKRPVAIKLEPDFHDELQNAAAWLHTTVNALIEEGAATLLEKLKKKHRDGKAFPPR